MPERADGLQPDAGAFAVDQLERWGRRVSTDDVSKYKIVEADQVRFVLNRRNVGWRPPTSLPEIEDAA